MEEIIARYDIAIVGSGPAGLSAALNAKLRNKSFIVFGSINLSLKVQKAEKINNYVGIPACSGRELGEAFKERINAMDIKITEEKINAIYCMGDYYSLMANEKMYEATSTILATGIEFTNTIIGEQELLGHGVSYCATCDGVLYKGKTVVVIGSSIESEKETNYLAKLADKIYFIPLYKSGKYNLMDKIQIIMDTPIEVKSDNKVVSRVVLKSGRKIETDGVFLIRDSLSPAVLLPGIKEEDGFIDVDRNMQTNRKGCFAAGDCVGRPFQYVKAASEGNIALHSAVAYLAKCLRKNN